MTAYYYLTIIIIFIASFSFSLSVILHRYGTADWTVVIALITMAIIAMIYQGHIHYLQENMIENGTSGLRSGRDHLSSGDRDHHSSDPGPS